MFIYLWFIYTVGTRHTCRKVESLVPAAHICVVSLLDFVHPLPPAVFCHYPCRCQHRASDSHVVFVRVGDQLTRCRTV